MRNPAGSSSKADIVESLLRLGDIARNSAVGEVQTALGKAKMLMEKYGLIQFDGRYQQLVEKLAMFLRGEKVEATKEEPKEETFEDLFGQAKQRYGSWRQQYESTQRQRREARKEAQRAERKARTAHRRAEKKEAKEEAKKTYTRPSMSAKIIWLWTLKYTKPRRGKAGERWTLYYGATTIVDMLNKGGKWSDVKKNILHGYMKVEA